MDRLGELRERVRDWFPNTPRDLMVWVLDEVTRLRARVAELEAELEQEKKRASEDMVPAWTAF